MGKIIIKESTMRRVVDEAIKSVGCLTEAKHYVNMGVSLRHGGRTAPKMTVKEFEDELVHAYQQYIIDATKEDVPCMSKFRRITPYNCVYTLCYNNKKHKKYGPLSAMYEDIWEGKYKFDSENVDSRGGIKVTSKGIPYIQCHAGGDWECPVCFFVYFDGSKLRGYVPTLGNAICMTTKEAFGNHDEEETEFLNKETNGKFSDNDNVNYNLEACLKDFTERLTVSGTYKPSDHSKTNEKFEELKKLAKEREDAKKAEREAESNNEGYEQKPVNESMSIGINIRPISELYNLPVYAGNIFADKVTEFLQTHGDCAFTEVDLYCPYIDKVWHMEGRRGGGTRGIGRNYMYYVVANDGGEFLMLKRGTNDRGCDTVFIAPVEWLEAHSDDLK